MLDEKILAARLFDEISHAVGENIPSTTRLPLCNAIAKVIVEHFKQYAEVQVPPHDPKMTAPAGAFVGPNFAIPPHQHNVTNLKHDTGKIT